MKTQFPAEWRTQTRWKRRIYSSYMKWLERVGYAVVTLVIGAFIFAFNYRVDEIVSADKVSIVAAATPLLATDRTLIVRQLVANYEEVQANQPILEVAIGDANVKRYLAWRSIRELGGLPGLEKPPLTTLVASVAGVLVVDESQPGIPVPTDTEIAQIRNYQELRMKPTLTGQGVANATSGGVASVSGVSIEPAAGVLLRGNESGRALVSGQMISKATRDEVERELANSALWVRDDIPLRFLEISELQVDADLVLSEATSGADLFIEPPPSFELKADVVGGSHIATVQFANLPKELQERVSAHLRKGIEDQVVTATNGDQRRITQARNLNTVFKAKAAPMGTGTPSAAIEGTALSRGFEADLRIQSPPAYLVHAIRQADSSGRSVTAKVVLKTGERLIATLLLKRS